MVLSGHCIILVTMPLRNVVHVSNSFTLYQLLLTSVIGGVVPAIANLSSFCLLVLVVLSKHYVAAAEIVFLSVCLSVCLSVT